MVILGKLLAFIHVISAMLAVGINLSYLFWTREQRRQPQLNPYLFHSLDRLDGVANRAYGVAIATGIAMMFLYQYPWTLTWVWGTLVCLALLGAIFAGLYDKPSRRLTALADAGELDGAEALALIRQLRLWGYVMIGLVLLIVLLMVWKPA